MERLIPIDILAHADFSGRIKRSRRNPGFAAFGAAIEAMRRENPTLDDALQLLNIEESEPTEQPTGE